MKKFLLLIFISGVIFSCSKSPAGDKHAELDSLKKVQVNLKEKITKLARDEDLAEIAAKLNRRYFGGRIQINSIEYASNQNSRFGSCNFHRKTIRISHRLAAMPAWVRDYVIVHELAHILEPNHGKSFYNLVSAYPLAERSRGFLLAKGFELEE